MSSGIEFPPKPSGYRLFQAGGPKGPIIFEPEVDMPPGFYLRDKHRKAATSRLVATYAMEQAFRKALPILDELSSRSSLADVRQRALVHTEAVCYRLRMDGYQYGADYFHTAEAALTMLKNTHLTSAEIIEAVASLTPRQWTARRPHYYYNSVRRS